MADDMTIVAGIVVPSTSPLFLTGVAVHVLLGIACVVTGLVAMLSRKGSAHHIRFGTVYYWCLAAVCLTATVLSVVRWSEDYHLFVLGAFSFAAGYFGRRALRQRWRSWPHLHVIGMGVSYILLLTAFYVDNGKNLPLWRELPQIAFWLLPGVFGLPIIIYVLRRHPVVRHLSHRART